VALTVNCTLRVSDTLLVRLVNVTVVVCAPDPKLWALAFISTVTFVLAPDIMLPPEGMTVTHA
jgi:hypothetical protein